MRKMVAFALLAFVAVAHAESDNCWEWRTDIGSNGKPHDYAVFVCDRPSGKTDVSKTPDIDLVLKEVSKDRVVLYDRRNMRTITIDRNGTTIW